MSNAFAPAPQGFSTEFSPAYQQTPLTTTLHTSLQSKSIAFIDAGVTDRQTLVAGLASGTEVVLLDNGDVISQITRKLLGQDGIASIQIFSHGTNGGLQLGQSWLNAETLPSYVSQIKSWGSALSTDADILLYGCNVAQDATGKAFINLFAQVAGADLAASDDLTGLGGDWDLEYQVGGIETIVATGLKQYQGTLEQVDYITFPEALDAYPRNFVELNGDVYFNANGSISGSEVWKINGNMAIRITDVNPGKAISNMHSLTVFNGKIYFVATNNSVGTELWATDGVNTSLVSDINLGLGGSDPTGLTIFNNQLYFTAQDGISGVELWRTDGTNTVRVADINPGSASAFPGGLTVYNEKLYFGAVTASSGGELWATDGVNTAQVADINPGSASASPGGLTVYNNKLYFAATTTTNGRELWMMDGVNTSLVSDLSPGTVNSAPINLTVFQGKLYFSATTSITGQELYKTDGITTSLVADIEIAGSSSNPGNLVVANNELYFTATTAARGTELYALSPDGSSTRLVADINPGSGSSSLLFLTEFDGALYFHATNDLNNSSGYKLWKTTPMGVEAVSDAVSGTGNVISPLWLTKIGTSLYGGSQTSSTYPRVWKIKPPDNLTIQATSNPVTYTEDNYSTYLFPTSPSIGGLKSPSVKQYTITATVINNASESDRLAIFNSNIAGLTPEGRIIRFNGIDIGWVDGGRSGQPLSIMFHANANRTLVEKVLASIQYTNFSQQIPIGGSNVTVRVTLASPEGKVAQFDRQINLVGQNDAPILGTATVLYEPTLQTTPDAQGWTFNGTGATQVFNNSVTLFDSMSSTTLQGGYGWTGSFNHDSSRLKFNLKLLQESFNGTQDRNVDSKSDRSGLSLMFMNAGTGLEIAFETNRIWVQNDGAWQTDVFAQADPSNPDRLLFTQSEGVQFDTTQSTDYELVIRNGLYTLYANEQAIMHGRKRFYKSNATPYRSPNLIFFGDNTTAAGAKFELGQVSLTNLTGSSLSAQTINEDTVAARNIIGFDADGDAVTISGTSSNISLLPNTNISISLSGNTRLVTVTPNPDASGSTNITLTANDGKVNSTPRTFGLTVNPVNDAPNFTLGTNLAVTAGIATQTITGWASNFQAGPNEASQVVLAYEIVSNDRPDLFDGVITIDPAGNLSFKPVTSVVTTGIATIGVRVRDNGGTANGGIDTSAIKTFTVTVNPPSAWTIAARADFNGDGKADIFWRNQTTGANRIWTMDGGNVLSAANIFTVNSDFQVAGVADFNGDGKADIFWRSQTTGANSIWTMDGSNVLNASAITSVNIAFQVAGIADFNGDRKADIFWRNQTTGANSIWTMDGHTTLSAARITSANSDFRAAAIADFNGDGKADIFWRSQTSGANSIWTMDGSTILNASAISTVNSDFQVAGVADFNGDGKADIFWRNQTTGANSIWMMNGSTILNASAISTANSDFQVAGIADFNGNGKADIFWRSQTTGANSIWTMDGHTVVNAAAISIVNLEFQISGITDFNGDGKADIFWRNQNNGANSIWAVDENLQMIFTALPLLF